MLQWSPEFKIGDILTTVALLLTALALVFTGIQIRLSRVANRHQFLFTAVDRYFEDDAARKFYYRVDYQNQSFSWKFDSKTFPGSSEEASLDYILHTYSLMEQLIRERVILARDIKVLGFEAIRVLENPEVVRYLEWLDKDYNEILGPNSQSFSDARNLAKRFREMRDERGRSTVG